VRGDPREVAAPTLSGPTGALATPADPVAATSAPVEEPTGQVTIDVTGKVRRPGIAVLDAGSRVVDALEAAGGARPGVDLTSLNLARVLVDGEQIVVGVAAPAGVASAVTPIPPGPAAGPLVNLNTADQALLETLPDVGPVTAEAIIAWRTEHGGFTAVDELLEVDGIGDATLETLTPHVTV
jgi:competence protein ComEA